MINSLQFTPQAQAKPVNKIVFKGTQEKVLSTINKAIKGNVDSKISVRDLGPFWNSEGRYQTILQHGFNHENSPLYVRGDKEDRLTIIEGYGKSINDAFRALFDMCKGKPVFTKDGRFTGAVIPMKLDTNV